MPREMHRKSLDGTRWTSTSSAATLKAPHGGGTHGLGASCNCTGRKDLQGLLSCGCSRLAGVSPVVVARAQKAAGAPARKWKTLLALNGFEAGALDGLEELGVYGKTEVEALKPGERSIVTIKQVLFGQPPLGVQPIVDQTNKALLTLAYRDVKIGAPKSYPLAWSWAWEPGPKVWTAYVSNPDAGPFLKELSIEESPYFIASDAAPTAEATRNFPTVGTVFSVDASPPNEVLSAEDQGKLRDALRTNVRSAPGTDVRTYLRVWGQKKPMSWLWAAAFFGGVAYAGKKLNDAR